MLFGSMEGEINESLAFRDGFVPSDSISFGRFETESLSWERRSSFTHNRYLEEVEKYAKTCPVSKKKAYFEAHFKRKSLMRRTSVDSEDTTDNQLNASNVDREDYTKDLKGLNDGHFDNTPDGSDEDKLKIDLNLHYFELSHENDDEEVPKSLSVSSVGFDAALEEEVHLTPPQVEIHFQDESGVHFSGQDDRIQEGEQSNSIEQQHHTVQLISMENPSKEHLENIGVLCTSSKETKLSTSKIRSSTGERNGHSKTKEKSDTNNTISRNRAHNVNGKPVREVTARKTVTKVQKSSQADNVIRKKAELPRIGKTNKNESVRGTSATGSRMQMNLGASNSGRRVPNEKTAPSNILYKNGISIPKNVKSAMTEFTKDKLSQGDRSENRDASDRKIRCDHDGKPLKDVLDSQMSTQREKVNVGGAVFNLKSDMRAEKRKEYYMKLEEKLHAKEIEINQIQAKNQEETEAQIKLFRRSLNFKATPMPAFYLGAAPRSTDLRKASVTCSKYPGPKKEPTSSYMSSASLENSAQQSTSLLSEASIAKPLDEKDDRSCSDAASTKIRKEGGTQSSSACRRKTEAVCTGRTKEKLQQSQRLLTRASKKDQRKSTSSNSGPRSVDHSVRNGKKPAMVPLVADVAVVS